MAAKAALAALEALETLETRGALKVGALEVLKSEERYSKMALTPEARAALYSETRAQLRTVKWVAWGVLKLQRVKLQGVATLEELKSEVRSEEEEAVGALEAAAEEEEWEVWALARTSSWIRALILPARITSRASLLGKTPLLIL